MNETWAVQYFSLQVGGDKKKSVKGAMKKSLIYYPICSIVKRKWISSQFQSTMLSTVGRRLLKCLHHPLISFQCTFLLHTQCTLSHTLKDTHSHILSYPDNTSTGPAHCTECKFRRAHLGLSQPGLHGATENSEHPSTPPSREAEEKNRELPENFKVLPWFSYMECFLKGNKAQRVYSTCFQTFIQVLKKNLFRNQVLVLNGD